MKVISGTITNIVPDGGYDGQNGHLYTFQMTIQGPNAAVVGQISSKSAVYPRAVGQPITVEMTQTQYGLRFKKVQDPQYAGQGSSPSKAAGKSEPDWDKIAAGKVLCNVICSAIQSNQMTCKTLADAQYYTDGIMGNRQTSPPPLKAATPPSIQQEFDAPNPEVDDEISF